MRHRSKIAIRIAVLCLIAIATSRAWAFSYRTVAIVRDDAPGTLVGAKFGAFIGAPALNNSGNTAFAASLFRDFPIVTGDNDSGIWSERGGTLSLVAREGSQAPGAPTGVNFGEFEDLNSPVLNNTGQISFWGNLQRVGSVTSQNDRGVWSEGSGTLSMLAREGNTAPNTTGVFSDIGLSVFNDAGQTAFPARLRSGVGGVNVTNDLGIWGEANGSLRLLARSGSAAPGAPDGVFDRMIVPVWNDIGQTAFTGFLRAGAGGISHNNDSGIWSGALGELQLVAREGNQAPGTPAGANFGDFETRREYPTLAALNNAGQTAFDAFLQIGGGGVTGDNDHGIWSEGSGALSLVAREGDQAPGTPNGATFASFASPLINATGQTAFIASLKTGAGSVNSTNDVGIWSERGGSLSLVARKGSQAPGMPDGTTFANVFSLALNAAGQCAFSANVLTDGPNGTIKNGIWAQNGQGELQLVVGDGDVFEVRPGDFRTVFAGGFLGNSGNQDGRKSGFNDLGQLAFVVSFEGGGTGIFVATPVPELSTLLAGAIGMTVIVMRLRVRANR